MPYKTLSSQLHFLTKASLGGKVDENIYPNSTIIEDWDSLYDLSQWHQIGALLFQHLDSAGENNAPSEYFGKLKEQSLNQAVFNMLFLKKSIAIGSDLAASKVNSFLMKGALWAWLLYESPGLREFGDIDFFLQKEHINAGLKVLADHNFEPDVYRKYLLATEKVAQLYFETDYQLPLTPTGNEMIKSLEIQWNTTYPRYHYSFNWKELTNKMMSVEISNTALEVPSVENQLLMMIIHHGGVEQWDKLKYMADLVRILRKFGKDMDWSYVISVTKRKGFHNLLLESLGLVNIFTGENYLIHCGKNLEKQYPSSKFYERVVIHWENTRIKPVTKSWQIFSFNMIYRDRLSDKLSILFSHIAYILEWRLIIPKARWYRKQP